MKIKIAFCLIIVIKIVMGIYLFSWLGMDIYTAEIAYLLFNFFLLFMVFKNAKSLHYTLSFVICFDVLMTLYINLFHDNKQNIQNIMYIFPLASGLYLVKNHLIMKYNWLKIVINAGYLITYINTWVLLRNDLNINNIVFQLFSFFIILVLNFLLWGGECLHT